MVMRDQVERRAEDMTATVAQDVNVFMDDVRLFYRQQVDVLVRENRRNPEPTWLQQFDQDICSRWGQVKAGCVIGGDGTVYHAAKESQDLRVQTFLDDNNRFFANKAVWEVYRAPARQTNDVLAVTADMPAEQDQVSVSGKMNVDKVAVTLPQSQKESIRLDGLVVDEKSRNEKMREKKTLSKSIAPARKAGLTPQALPAPKPNATALAENSQSQSLKDKNKAAPISAEIQSAAAGRETRPAPVPAAPSSSFVNNKQQKMLPQKTSTMKYNVAPQNSKLRSQIRGQASGESNKAESVGLSSQIARPQQSLSKKGAPETIAPGKRQAVAAEGKSFAQVQRGLVLTEKTQSPTNQPADETEELIGQIGRDNQKLAAAQVQAVDHFANLEADSVVMEEVIGQEREGALGRFLDDGLHIYLWYRPLELNSKIFWVELDLNEIRRGLKGIITGATFPDSEGFCLGLLDEGGQLVGKNSQDFGGDWSKWLVNSEVGSILPRWMVTAYVVNPNSLIQSAKSLRLTILLLVSFLIVAIGIGGWLIIKETGREMYLARQKTDFVSNVSHELKTPLTSIRMFSELLKNVETVDDSKRVEYAGIIDSETGRLTRLINQLLDFSRLERGGKRYDFEELDVAILTKETVENYRHQLEADGAKLRFLDRTEGNVSLADGDRDALSQILLNLLSNAEKYGGSSPEIDVEVELVADSGRDKNNLIEIRVKDRGEGISRRESTRIFEKFYRVDDSLASGIEGSGLGLSLARQLARAHGGDLEYRNRKNGGSCFVLSLPASKTSES